MSFERKLKKFIYGRRFLCVIWETMRYCWHKTLGGFIRQPYPIWYAFDKTPKNASKELLPINKAWHKTARSLYRHEHVFYNIQNALKANPNLKGLALIYFMGIGDYLYTTPMLESLAKEFPKLDIYAYVSKHFDRNNSPIVGTLLETNPAVKKVFYFDGFRNPLVWKNYDYKDALKNIPQDFLVLPVYYEYGKKTAHRTQSLFETFGLKPSQNIYEEPRFYFPPKPSQAVEETYDKIAARAKKKKGIVFLQLDSRASFYKYPFIDELIRGLLRKDYFVLSVTPSAVVDYDFMQLDIKKFSFNETCHLLSLLKKSFPVYIIALNSVFWAASAGLKIPNLGLQHWIDKKVHNLWYPNITVVTDYVYPALPKDKMITAAPADYTRYNKKIINYKVPFILKCFEKTFESVNKNPKPAA